MMSEEERDGLIRSALVVAVVGLSMLCVWGNESAEKKYREKHPEEDPSKITKTSTKKEDTFKDLDICLVSPITNRLEKASQTQKPIEVAASKEAVSPQPAQPVIKDEQPTPKKIEEKSKDNPMSLIEREKKIKEGLYNTYFRVGPVFEGCTEYFYLCKNGKLTVGMGVNVDKEADFMRLVFYGKDGKLLNDAQKKALYKKYQAAKAGSYGRYYTWYEGAWAEKDGFTRPTRESVQVLERERVRNACNKAFEKFRNMGLNLCCFVTEEEFKTGRYDNSFALAIVDMMYNMGEGKFASENWPCQSRAFVEGAMAYRQGDDATFRKCMLTASQESHREGVQDTRNNWTSNCVVRCKGMVDVDKCASTDVLRKKVKYFKQKKIELDKKKAEKKKQEALQKRAQVKKSSKSL